MQVEPEIAFRHVEPTEAVQTMIASEIDRLDALDDRLIACRVMVELPERRHKTGNKYHVRIDLTAPGEEILVDRHPSSHQEHEDLFQAIGEAFDTARKRLLDAKARRRNDVKRHVEHPRGRVREMFHELDYGFIEAAEGYDVYFHRNAVRSGSFDGLSVGAAVRYVETEGDNGPQATMVEVI